jgi:multimeric flavodoxin WrbA/protein-tyrosine-phosphatase
MFVLGLMGSPRRGGNTDGLLSAFLEGAEGPGTRILKIDVGETDIAPCQGCRFCEERGFCRVEGDEMAEVYRHLRMADLVVLATPVFFYTVPAQLKAIMDRCQVLWARKYIFKLADPKARFRRGFVLTVGATEGKELFSGINLTARYFFDAIDASFEGVLGYRGIEARGDVDRHPTALLEARQKGQELTEEPSRRKRVLFHSRENACLSQMGEAFLHFHGGDSLEAHSGGDEPAGEINPLAVQAMAEKGIDLAYWRPKALEGVVNYYGPFDLAVQIGAEIGSDTASAPKMENWPLEGTAGRPVEAVREARDEIERRVKGLLKGELANCDR